MATTISTQDLIDVKRDIDDTGKAVNEKVIVSPRYGADFKSIPMLATEAQGAINEWESAISLITQEGGVPALAVSDASGETQQTVNLRGAATWHERPGGYSTGDTARLANGDIVKSMTPNNTANPNTDMTGWVDVSAAQNIKNSLGGSVQDFIDDQLSKTNLLLNISVTPEMYGAKGNGIDDDTSAVAAWWSSPFVFKQARGKYKVNFGNSGVLLNLTRSLEIDMVGAEFLPTEQARFFMRIQATTDIKSIIIKGGHTVSNNLIARNLEILGEGMVGNISVYFNSATEIKENGQGGSAVGLHIEAKADIIDVHHNDYQDIDRITVNPLIVASVGISIQRVVGTCLVYGNNIERVRTPVDQDSDGISIFSDTRLISPSQVQKVNIRVFNNKLRDCEGRFIKMQAPAQVYGNDFRSETGKLIPEFRAVDAQYGCADVFGNEWRVADGVTGASTAVFCMQDLKGDTGAEDNVGGIFDNKLYLAQKIRYLAHIRTVGGKHVIRIKDNVVKDEDGILKVEDMARLTIESASAIGSLALSIENNELTLGTSALLVLFGAGFASSTLNSKLVLTIADNRPKNVLSGSKIIETNAAAVNPYLGDILIKNNGDPLIGPIQARGINVLKLRQGNQFYYATDGSTGGMLNCPNNYNRYVYVNIQSSLIELTNATGEKKAVKGNTATWYEYTGTTIV